MAYAYFKFRYYILISYVVWMKLECKTYIIKTLLNVYCEIFGTPFIVRDPTSLASLNNVHVVLSV